MGYTYTLADGWKNYGDVDHFNYGGLFVHETGETTADFVLTEPDENNDDNGSTIYSGMVDFADDWIDVTAFYSAEIADWNSEESGWKIQELLGHYSRENFGADYGIKVESEHEYNRILVNYGILTRHRETVSQPS